MNCTNRIMRMIMSGFALLALLAFPAITPLFAQEFPNRPIKMIVPFSPGGATDIIARTIAQKMSGPVGQPVLVENRPGAGSMIGTRAPLQAPADGYMILLGTGAMASILLLTKEPGYKMEDFSLLAPVGSLPFVMLINEKVPGKTLSEFVTYAKANPKNLNYGYIGEGSPMHLLTERLKSLAGFDMAAIPYSGASQALTNITGGALQVYFNSAVTAVPLLKGERVRALAITSAGRIPMASEVPTFKESGYPDLVGGVWYAVYTAARVPGPILKRLADAAMAAVALPDVRDALAQNGIEQWTGTAQEFEVFVKKDLQRWQSDVEHLGLKPQ